MAKTITIGKLVIESKLNDKHHRRVRDVNVETFKKNNPNDRKTLEGCTKISGQKAKKAYENLKIVLEREAFTVHLKNNGKLVINYLESKDEEFKKTKYFVKWFETWEGIEHKTSTVRNQYIAPGSIKKLNGNQNLLAHHEIKLPKVEVISDISRPKNREFLAEKYKVRARDTFMSIFNQMYVIRNDTSLKAKDLLALNNLPDWYLSEKLALPLFLKLPKPKNATRITKKMWQFIRDEEATFNHIYHDGISLKTNLNILKNEDENGIVFDFKKYQDINGNATIGIGHTLQKRPPTYEDGPWIKTVGSDDDEMWVVGELMSAIDIELYFEEDIKKAEGKVTYNTTVPLNQNQFDALVSLAFNTGNIDPVKRFINNADFKGACTAWRSIECDYPELKNRRNREADIFETPV